LKYFSYFLGFILLLPGITTADAKPFRPMSRIIALSPHSVEMLFVLGAGDRIIATTKFSNYPAQAKSIPRIGGYNGIQIERVLALKPDLIIAWMDGNKIEDIEKMEKLGLNVYRSKTRSLDNIPHELIKLGKMIGLADSGEKAAKAFNTRLQNIRLENETKPPVSFFYQLWDEPLRAMAAGSWINTVMVACGGENVFNNPALDYPEISIENVLIASPEVFFIPSHHGSYTASVDKWRKWPEIPAIANDQIYFIDGDLLHRFSTRVLDGMEQVCIAFDKVRASRSNAVTNLNITLNKQ
jgi:vitamin B12 transport system substrate-binding protein